MTEPSRRPRRPRSVRLVTVLSWIEGFIDIAGGLLLLGIAGASVLDPVQGGILLAGAAGISLGLVLVFVTGGLLRGSRGSRIAVTVLSVFSMVPAVVTLSLTLWVNGAITIGLGTAIIVLLWAGPARRHFARASRAPEASAADSGGDELGADESNGDESGGDVSGGEAATGPRARSKNGRRATR